MISATFSVLYAKHKAIHDKGLERMNVVLVKYCHTVTPDLNVYTSTLVAHV